jgi:hypothetical protein
LRDWQGHQAGEPAKDRVDLPRLVRLAGDRRGNKHVELSLPDRLRQAMEDLELDEEVWDHLETVIAVIKNRSGRH